MTRSCWKSFSPKSATWGRNSARSLVTTVATPAEVAGPLRAAQPLAEPRSTST